MTPDQRAKQKIIDSIRALTHYKAYTLGQIEKTLGLPQNTLSGMLNGSRNMSPKWQRLLTEFIMALPKEDKTITIKIDQEEAEPMSGEYTSSERRLSEKLRQMTENVTPHTKKTLPDLVDKSVAITKTSATAPPAAIDPFSPEGQKIIQAAKKPGKPMPPGLTKAQQIRWHRENGQTLL